MTARLILSFSFFRKLYKFCSTCSCLDRQDRLKTFHFETAHKFKAAKDLGFLKVGDIPENGLEGACPLIRFAFLFPDGE